MQRVIFVTVGQSALLYSKSTLPALVEYAAKVKAKLVIQPSAIFSPDVVGMDNTLPWNKIDQLRSLPTDCLALFIDADIFIKPDAPDIFEHGPGLWAALDVAMFADPPYVSQMNDWVGDGFDYTKHYLNFGVLLIDGSTAAEFSKYLVPPYETGPFYSIDQNYLVRALYRSKIPFKLLDQAWNTPNPILTKDVSQGYFLHTNLVAEAQAKDVWLRRFRNHFTFESAWSTITSMTSRLCLPRILDQLRMSLMIEVGVQFGEFSSTILDSWPGRIYGIDPYVQQDPLVYADYANVTNIEQLDTMDKALQRLRAYGYGRRFRLIRDFSPGCIDRIMLTIGIPDCVYLDGNHGYGHAVKEIRDWWSILTPGCILGGHDYNTVYGVKRAVDEFVAENKIPVHITGEPNDPSWFVLK